MIVLRLDTVTFSHPGGLVLQELSWPIQTGQKLGQLSGHSHQVNIVAFSPDGSQILSSSLDETVRI